MPGPAAYVAVDVEWVNPPISYDLPGAAAAVGLSDRTLRDAVADGSLVVHYLGRKPLVHREDLDEWVRSLPTTSPKERALA